MGNFELYAKQIYIYYQVMHEIAIILSSNQLYARCQEVYENYNLILYDIILLLGVLLFLQNHSKLHGFASKLTFCQCVYRFMILFKHF